MDAQCQLSVCATSENQEERENQEKPAAIQHGEGGGGRASQEYGFFCIFHLK